MKVGILVNRDPTLKGIIKSEIEYLDHFYDGKVEFYLIVDTTYYLKVAKRIIASLKTDATIINFKNISILDKLDVLFTWPISNNFYGGIVYHRNLLYYEMISHFSHNVGPVFIKLSDSENPIKDYKQSVEKRFDEPFITDNKKLIDVSKSITKINYENVFWLGNGSIEIYDWIVKTLYDRLPAIDQFCDRDLIIKNSIYLSDDIFFNVRNNFDLIKSNKQYNNSLCYIGFFDHANKKRTKVLDTILENVDIPVDIRGKKTTNLNISNKSIDIREEILYGEDYWNYLSSHLGYIFIGKGNKINYYINKTIYDCVVAKIPIIIYRNTDTNHAAMQSDEMYFETDEELKALYEKLLDPKERNRIIKEQEADVFSRLPKKNPLNFNKFTKPKNEKIKLIKKLF